MTSTDQSVLSQCQRFPMLGAVVALVVLMRLPTTYRTLRPYWGLLASGVLIYRAMTVGEGSIGLLQQLSNEVDALRQCCGSWPAVKHLSDLVGLVLILTLASLIHRLITTVMDFVSFEQLYKSIAQAAYRLVRDIPLVKAVVASEVTKLEQSLETELKIKSRALGAPYKVLPERGLDTEAILSLMARATKTEDPKWMEGHISGAVYHSNTKHIDLLNRAFNYYSMSNCLFPAVWPSVMKFESEIIAMTASLVNGGDDGVCGSTTSGGSESVILAIKAHRDYYLDRFGVKNPELVCGVSAHAAVDKACDMLNIKLIKVALHPTTLRVDLSAARRAITANTIMLYASAPSYPHGAIDDITAMGALAQEYRIGLHVDCCLGGFVLPFAKQLEMNIPEFDFTIPGVTSMSLDAHKYGYSLKGSSVVLYRNKSLRHAQYFCYADWTGGLFTTATMAGSRSGGLVAQAWASMMSMGQEQYRQHAKEILTSTRFIASGVAKIAGLMILGNVDAMIVCFTSNDADINIYCVGDAMKVKGWNMSTLQYPACLHLCLTLTHLGREEQFLVDLEDAVKTVKTNPTKRDGNAAIYGLTATLPPGPVQELLKAYNDVVLSL